MKPILSLLALAVAGLAAAPASAQFISPSAANAAATTVVVSEQARVLPQSLSEAAVTAVQPTPSGPQSVQRAEMGTDEPAMREQQEKRERPQR